MNKSDTNEQYITLKTLCGIFAVSERTVFRWIKDGCPSLEIGKGKRKMRRFRISDVEAWINNQNEVSKR